MIQGTVRDPSGALVAGAQVIVSSSATFEVKSAKTDAQGRFSIDGVASRDCRITVRREGFEDSERNITVGTEPKLDVDIQLKIQAQETVVKVTGKRSALANSDANYRELRDSKISDAIRIENVTLKCDATVPGRVAIAVFSGKAAFRLDPAVPMEANYLQMMTESRTFDEEFESAVLYFTDGTFEELKRQGAAAAPHRESAQLPHAQKSRSVARSLSVRMAEEYSTCLRAWSDMALARREGRGTQFVSWIPEADFVRGVRIALPSPAWSSKSERY